MVRIDHAIVAGLNALANQTADEAACWRTLERAVMSDDETAITGAALAIRHLREAPAQAE